MALSVFGTAQATPALNDFVQKWNDVRTELAQLWFTGMWVRIERGNRDGAQVGSLWVSVSKICKCWARRLFLLVLFLGEDKGRALPPDSYTPWKISISFSNGEFEDSFSPPQPKSNTQLWIKPHDYFLDCGFFVGVPMYHLTAIRGSWTCLVATKILCTPLYHLSLSCQTMCPALHRSLLSLNARLGSPLRGDEHTDYAISPDGQTTLNILSHWAALSPWSAVDPTFSWLRQK